MRAPLLSEASNPTWVAMEVCVSLRQGCQESRQGEAGGGSRKAFPAGLSRGQEETRMVSAVPQTAQGLLDRILPPC